MTGDVNKLLWKKKKVRCFNCNEEDHIKDKCPKFKKKSKEKAQPKLKVRNLKLTWRGTSSSKDSKEELKHKVGLAFVAIHKGVEDRENNSSNKSQGCNGGASSSKTKMVRCIIYPLISCTELSRCFLGHCVKLGITV